MGQSHSHAAKLRIVKFTPTPFFMGLVASDFDLFRLFANAADIADSGDAAERKHLSYPVARLAEAVLGKGPWQPKPETWKEGVEREQFRGGTSWGMTRESQVDPALVTGNGD